MYVFLNTRTIVKTYSPVVAPMVMVREGTDQMDKFDIQRAPTISEDGLQLNSPAGSSALLLEGGTTPLCYTLLQHMIILPQQNSQRSFLKPKINIWIGYILVNTYQMTTSRRVHINTPSTVHHQRTNPENIIGLYIYVWNHLIQTYMSPERLQGNPIQMYHRHISQNINDVYVRPRAIDHRHIS